MAFSVCTDPVVLLIDRDPVYLERLVYRLSPLLQIPILTCNPEQLKSADGLGVLEPAVRSRVAIVLADPDSCQWIRQNPFIATPVLITAWTEPAPSNALGPYRLMPVSKLANWLRDQLAALPVRPADKRDCMTVTVDMGWFGHESWLRKYLTDAHLSGMNVIYLPLKPTFRMGLIHSPGQGPNLTALLLRISQGENLSPGELGHYLEPHPVGYWQFRPPDRSDDVAMASLPAVRELVSLVRRRAEAIRQETGQAVCCVVDLAELPLQTMTALVVLADQLAVRFETGDDYARQSFQRELALLLARLPSGCQILEMEQCKTE